MHRAALLRELGASDEPLPDDLSELGEYLSAREREAAQIEYQADELCLAWLLDSVLFEEGWEATFDGEIVGVIGSGIFVRFADVFEGLLPARRLLGDYFEPNGLGTALVGRRGGGTFRLGDPIEVRVERIDRTAGQVELSLPFGRREVSRSGADMQVSNREGGSDEEARVPGGAGACVRERRIGEGAAIDQHLRCVRLHCALA